MLAGLTDHLSSDGIIEVSIAKGVLFVVLSGLVLGVLLTRSQHRVNESEQRVLSLFYSHPDPMWVYDTETLRILDVNEAAILLYGYTKEEFTGLSIDDLRPDSEHEHLHAYLKGLTNNTVSKSGLWQHKTKTGHAFWANIRSAAIAVGSKKARMVTVNEVSSMVQHWSEAVNPDPAVFEALQRLKIVADSIQDGFVFLNENVEIIQTNVTFRSKARGDDLRLEGRSILAVTDWLPHSEFQRVLEVIKETGKSGTMEVYNRHLAEWYRLVLYPNDTGYAIFLRDITAEKDSERKLLVEHGRLTTLINNTDSLIFTVDRNRHLTLYNNSFAELLLMSRAYPPILGECPTDMPVFGPITTIWDDVFESVLEGAVHSSEVLIMSKDRTYRYRLMRMAPLIAHGTTVGVGVVMQDVHELRSSLDKLRQSNAVFSDIAQISSHELRGPLTTIMMLLQLIDVDNFASAANADVLRQLQSVSADVDTIVHRIVAMTQSLNG